jgi:IS1 family transposase
MDWDTLYCPNRGCSCYGRPFHQGLLVKNGTTRGQKQALCRACGRSIALNTGTAYFELDAAPALFDTAIRALAEGNSLRATGRIVQIDKDTACAWLHRAAVQCRLVMLYLWQGLSVTECQLDELWRLVLAFVVGKRTQASANLLLERVAQVTDERIPFFTSDQLAEYRTALLHVYGQWYQPVRNGNRGRYPERRVIAPPDLLYAQVVKQRERGSVVAVTTKVVFGDPEAITAQLHTSLTSTTINTSFVERENFTLRQSNRRLTRKTSGFSKELPWLEKQLWLSLAYYHLVLPHQSLRQPLHMPEPTRGSGSARCWCPITPAMAAGMTDHDRVALLPRARRVSGPGTHYRTSVSILGTSPSRDLRDITQ